MINFTGKLIIDKSFYSLRHSNAEKIIEKVKHTIENPFLSDLLKDDIHLSAKGSAFQDKIIIKANNITTPIVSKNEITPTRVINQIFLNFCADKNIQPRSSKRKHIIEAIVDYLKK